MSSELFKVEGSTQGFCVICDHDLEAHEVLLEFEDGLPVTDSPGMMICPHPECTCNTILKFDNKAKKIINKMIEGKNDYN